jgi:ADP-ribose pyrophosphatase YjhB (NUDIX family)
MEQLRRSIGTSLLLLVPCVAVLPRDRDGRRLLVRHIDSGLSGTIGGAVEPDEPPESAPRREAREEASVEVELRSILAVAGGPHYRVTYPNGDEVSCVVVAYDAAVCSGPHRTTTRPATSGGSPRPRSTRASSAT